jgi:hypothetical protein
MTGIILDPNFPISAHVLDQPKPRPYAERQVRGACADVEKRARELAKWESPENINRYLEDMGINVDTSLMDAKPTDTNPRPPIINRAPPDKTKRLNEGLKYAARQKPFKMYQGALADIRLASRAGDPVKAVRWACVRIASQVVLGRLNEERVKKGILEAANASNFASIEATFDWALRAARKDVGGRNAR